MLICLFVCSCAKQEQYASREEMNEALIKAVRGVDASKVKELLGAGADPNALGSFDVTPLGLAVLKDSTEIAAELLASGADINHPQNTNCEDPVLFIAIRTDKTEMAKLLIKNNADINALNMRKATPLIVAACRGNKELVELLLEKGADVGQLGGYFQVTAYDRAVAQGFPEVAGMIQNASKTSE